MPPRVEPVASSLDLVRMFRSRRSRTSALTPPEFEIAPIDLSDPFGLVVDDGDLVVLDVITEGEGTADPEALSLRGSNLVADALGRWTSLSNWANDKSTLSVSRPIDVVV